MAQLIADWPGSRSLAQHPLLRGEGVPLATVALLAPLPSPGAIVAVGKNYADHVKEMDAAPFGQLTQPAVPTVPIIFTKAPTSVVGPNAAIRIPAHVTQQARAAARSGRRAVWVA